MHVPVVGAVVLAPALAEVEGMIATGVGTSAPHTERNCYCQLTISAVDCTESHQSLGPCIASNRTLWVQLLLMLGELQLQVTV